MINRVMLLQSIESFPMIEVQVTRSLMDVLHLLPEGSLLSLSDDFASAVGQLKDMSIMQACEMVLCLGYQYEVAQLTPDGSILISGLDVPRVFFIVQKV